MLAKDQSRNNGDFIATGRIYARVNPTASLQLGAAQNARIDVGRVLVPDLGNIRVAAAADRAVPNSPLGDLGNWLFPAAVGEVRRRVGIVADKHVFQGQPVSMYHDGIVVALASDTIANLAAGVFVTVSFANDNSRGTIRLAAAGEPIIGQVLVPPGTNGTAAAPQPCTIDFFGVGAFTRPMP